MSTSIDALLMSHGAHRPALTQRVDRLQQYHGSTFTTPTIIYDSGDLSGHAFHIQRCYIRVGGTPGHNVEKSIRISVGLMGERVIVHDTVQNTDTTIEVDLRDMLIMDRIVVDIAASTPLNAYSSFLLEGYMYAI